MPIEQANCMRRFVRMCADAWEQGWHESNAGNLSYRLDEEDIRVCMPFFSIKGEGHEWHGLGFADSDLAGQFFMVTAGGSPLRKVGIDPAINCGVVEIDGEGKAWRKVWGLKGTHPTSEFSSHLLAHAVFIRETDGDNRVVYHAHAPNVTALSLLLEPDEAQWNRALWGVMTEVIMLAPQGVGVLPWMLPGSKELAVRTAAKLEAHDAVVWTQHGIIVREQTFDDAFGLAHAIEKAAGIYLNARAANGGHRPEHLVSPAQLAAICEKMGLDFDVSALAAPDE